MKPAALLALLLLSACQKAEITEREQAVKASNITIYHDEETGCEYVSGWRGGMAARISADGKSHRGCKTPLLEK